MVYRVADHRATVDQLTAGGWTVSRSLEIPQGPCTSFRTAGDLRIAVYQLVRPQVLEHFAGPSRLLTERRVTRSRGWPRQERPAAVAQVGVQDRDDPRSHDGDERHDHGDPEAERRDDERPADAAGRERRRVGGREQRERAAAIGVPAATRQLDQERRDDEAAAGAGQRAGRRRAAASSAARSAAPRRTPSPAARPGPGRPAGSGRPASRSGPGSARIAMPSATKNSPMFAPAASARCGRNATMTPQCAMYSKSMTIEPQPRRRNAKPEAPTARRRRPVGAGLVLAGRARTGTARCGRARGRR